MSFTRSGRRDGKRDIQQTENSTSDEPEIISGNFPYISMDSEIHQSNAPNFPAIGESTADEQAAALFAVPGYGFW